MPLPFESRENLLLAAHPLMRATDQAQARLDLRQTYNVQDVTFAASKGPFLALANRVELPGLTLHYCRYDTPVEIAFGAMAGFRQFFCLNGEGSLTFAGNRHPLSRTATAIVPPNVSFLASYGGGYTQLVLQFDEATLLREIERMLGHTLPADLVLSEIVSANFNSFFRLKAVALALAAQFDQESCGNARVIAQLESAVILSFLFDNETTVSSLMPNAGPAPDAPDVALMERYIRANWNKPLTVPAIADACHVSVRSVFARLKAQRGVSPMAYLREVRLEEAHRQLLQGDSSASVLDVALACGFLSFGHFARRYKVKFGELPSATLARRGLKTLE